MDADGEVSLPVKGGKHLKEDFVGKAYPEYDFTVVLSHFKGHPMGGFGGAIKNISIGIASSFGEGLHSFRRKNEERERVWGKLPPQDVLRVDGRSGQSCGRPCGDRILVYQRGQ